MARGGLQFMLIIWLQGIWLPLHGYDFEATPLWAGHLHAAADRRVPGRRADLRATCPTGSAPRLLATGGLLLVAASFLGLLALPVDFSYPALRRCCSCSAGSARACSPHPTRPRS